jgi:hypothetical protein
VSIAPANLLSSLSDKSPQGGQTPMRFEAVEERTSPFVHRPLLSLSSSLLAIAVGLISSFTFSTAYDMARAALFGHHQAIYGVWHGQRHGVHAVTIRLEKNGDGVRGTARFSKIIETGDGPRVVGETPELSLINPSFNGERLFFEVQSGEETGLTVVPVMEMSFINEAEAELRRTGRQAEDASQEKALTIIMKKEQSF